MNETFETNIGAEAYEASSPDAPTLESIATSPEQIVEAVDGRIDSFSENIFDADAKIKGMGVEGPEALALSAQYNQMTNQMKGHLGRAGDIVKSGILGGAIALGGGNALAEETGMQSLEEQVAAFASDPNEGSLEIPTLTGQESSTTIETPSAEIVPTDNSESLPPKEDIPEVFRTPAQGSEVQNEGSSTEGGAEDAGAAFRVSERNYANETPQDRRYRMDREILQDTVGVLTDPNFPKDGKVGGYMDKHGTFIVQKFFPGAGLKHALTGVDEYGETLSGVERLKSFGEGTLELATYGGSKVLKSLGVLFRTGRAAEKLSTNKDTSSAAGVVSEVTKAIPGGTVIKNVANVVEVATDPTIRAVSDVMHKSMGSETVNTSVPTPTETTSNTEAPQ